MKLLINLYVNKFQQLVYRY